MSRGYDSRMSMFRDITTKLEPKRVRIKRNGEIVMGLFAGISGEVESRAREEAKARRQS